MVSTSLPAVVFVSIPKTDFDFSTSRHQNHLSLSMAIPTAVVYAIKTGTICCILAAWSISLRLETPGNAWYWLKGNATKKKPHIGANLLESLVAEEGLETPTRGL